MKKLVKIILAVLLAFAAVFSMACGDSENAVTAPGLRFMKFKGDDFYTVYGYGAEEGVASLDIGKIAARHVVKVYDVPINFVFVVALILAAVTRERNSRVFR